MGTLLEWALFGLLLTPGAVYWLVGFEPAVIVGIVMIAYLQLGHMFRAGR